jgi:catechol 2,3-dioxygenase-like lactoylglutathione lyase family enzyme
MSVKVWYPVRDLEAGRAFYTRTLGFGESYVDGEGGWATLARGPMEIVLVESAPGQDGGVATIDVHDVKAEAERLRSAGVDVGVVFELHGQVRLLDVYDPDGNRIQLAQLLDGPHTLDEQAPAAR